MSDTKRGVLEDDAAIRLIGVGVHTGLRKGTDAPESADLWRHIANSERAWEEAVEYAVRSMREMGYRVVGPDQVVVEYDEVADCVQYAESGIKIS
jgi:hypothetical protein